MEGYLYDFDIPVPSIEELLVGNILPFNIGPENETESPLSSTTVQTASYIPLISNLKFAVGILSIICTLIGMIANLCIIVLSCKILSKSTKQETQHLCILSMALADLLFVSIHCPIIFAGHIFRPKFPKWLCMFLLYGTHLSLVTSSLSLLCLNIDKFICLCFPFRYLTLVSLRRSKIFISICWLMAIGWATFYVFGPLFQFEDNCDIYVAEPHATKTYLAFFILFFVVPITISMVISVNVFVIARRSRFPYTCVPQSQNSSQWRFRVRFSKKSQGDSIDSTPNDDPTLTPTEKKMVRQETSSSFQRFQKQVHRSSGLKTALFVFSATIWAVITLVPYRLVYLTISQRTGHWTKWVTLVTYAVLIMNPVGNPFVTVISQPQYQKRILALFGVKRKSGEGTPASSVTQKSLKVHEIVNTARK